MNRIKAVMIVAMLIAVQIEVLAQEGKGTLRNSRESSARNPMRVTVKEVEALAHSVGVAMDPRVLEKTPVTSQEIRIRWNTSIAPAGTQTPPQDTVRKPFTIIRKLLKSEPAPLQRFPRISSDKIMIFALNASGELHDWILIPDPRILRAEFPDDSGRLNGRILHRRNPEFLVQLPYDPAVTDLCFYHPNWTGKKYTLKLLSKVSIR